MVHSFFLKAPDQRDEYYFFELKPAEGSKIVWETLTNAIRSVTNDFGFVAPGLFDANVTFPIVLEPEPPTQRFEHAPNWFAPGPNFFYEEWNSTGYNMCLVLRDKKTGRIFICAQKDF